MNLTEDEAAALLRVGEFCRAVRRARGWTQPDVYTRLDAIGEPYVSLRTYGHVERVDWASAGWVPNTATWQLVELALRLPPGTLLDVLASPDHGHDPAGLVEWEPPRQVSRASLRASRAAEAARPVLRDRRFRSPKDRAS